jgi:putative transposase
VVGVQRGMDWKKLLGSIPESVDEELRLRNAYLQAENRILRQQIHGRIQLMDGDRKALAELGQQLGKKALEEIATIAKPNTILAWHRTLADQKVDTSEPYTFVGRPRIGKELEDLVVRMARENRSWGYDRIVGALANLGYRISDQSVGNILKRHGIPPAPVRKTTTTWKEFIRIHMAVLGATDFFPSEGGRRCALVISSLCWLLSGRFHHVHAVGIALYHPMRWMLMSLLWSPVSGDLKLYQYRRFENGRFSSWHP